ncbi:hypothetical protein imdm_528 [gamma proteobacterium IMCC2047]|nr:hypothetical protein imdm_528 [gamma proteobacterium IMCC2047]
MILCTIFRAIIECLMQDSSMKILRVSSNVDEGVTPFSRL